MIVETSKLTPGIVVGKDILTRHGSIFIAKGTILTSHMIHKLSSLDFHQIDVEELRDQVPGNEQRKDITDFISLYQKSMILTGEILDSISSGKKFAIEQVRETADLVMQQISTTGNIWGRLMDQRNSNSYLNKHSLNVAILSGCIGKWLGFSELEIRRLVYSGLLHDIGKLKVSRRILEKPSKLTDDEYKEVQKHPVFGYQMLASRPDISKDVISGVLNHHERVDGSGYPSGLKGDSIHLFGKILAVADVFDAMSTNKNYREKHSPFKVAEEISKSSFGTLDPKVCRVFLDNISKFYVGNKVLLSDGRVGDIIYINPSDSNKPVVKISDDVFIDLSKDKLKIVDILS